jgi:hypothetical protein
MTPSEAQRWQIIGMHTTGMSFKAIGRQMGYHYTVVSRLVRKHIQTNNVKYLPRSGRPRIMKQKPALVWPMSLNSNHVVLNTMPNVIVDVDLPTVDVYWLSLTYVPLILDCLWLRVYLSWLQAGFSHHTRQSNWWSVHQRRLATSCCPPFRQPPTSYNDCVYGWQHQAWSFNKYDQIVISLSKRHLWITWRHLLFKVQYRV